MALYLVSDGSSFLTGETVFPHGGLFTAERRQLAA